MNNKLKRPDNGPVSNIHVAEVTTRQLTAYLCLALCAFAFFFGLGIITGRLDPSFDKGQEPIQNEAPSEVESYSVPALSQDQAGKDESLKEQTTTSQAVERTPETATPRNPYMAAVPGLTSMRPDPLSTEGSGSIHFAAPEKEPLPVTTTEGEKNTEAAPTLADTDAKKQAALSASSIPVTPVAPVTPAATQTPTAPAATPVTQTPAASATVPATPVPASPAKPAAEVKDKPLLTPITPDEPPIEDLALEPLAPTPAPVPPPAPAAVSGKFGIQLAAFTGADRSARAEALQKKLNTESKVQTQIIPSTDNQAYRVVVGGFPDKAAAEKALNDIRAKTGFPQAFVKAL
ncbi:MAG TPA: SPOR domain-containing protein [Candidatus Hydrogenedentes bacterium]|mgnify:FL=1|nr:SPOR domain-containing protein [Candidatus Hydrogenedentota bacterium]